MMHLSLTQFSLRRSKTGLKIFWALLWILASSASVQAEERARIFIYGDSLAAGYGLAAQDGFAAQLKRALEARQMRVDIYNASQSGETSAGGLARLDWSLKKIEGGPPNIAILELGANDALRAMPPAQTRINLDRILTRLKAHQMIVILAGMMAPPNLGRVYGEKFNIIYPQLAKKHKVIFYPFFLEGVAGERSLNLLDGLHPNAQGIRKITIGILPFVEEAIKKVNKNKSGGK